MRAWPLCAQNYRARRAKSSFRLVQNFSFKIDAEEPRTGNEKMQRISQMLLNDQKYHKRDDSARDSAGAGHSDA